MTECTLIRGQKNPELNAFVCGQKGCVSACALAGHGHLILGTAWFGSCLPCERECWWSGSGASGVTAFEAAGLKQSLE